MRELVTVPVKRRIRNHRQLVVALRTFEVTDNDIREDGLRAIKERVKRQFRKIAFDIHPDRGGTGGYWTKSKHYVTYQNLHKYCQLIQKMRIVPTTLENVNKILELTKGYKTTEEVDFGLNGYENTRELSKEFQPKQYGVR